MCLLATDDFLCGCLSVVDIVYCDKPTCIYQNLYKGMLVDECVNRKGGCSRPERLPVVEAVDHEKIPVDEGGYRTGGALPVVTAFVKEIRQGSGRKRTGRDVLAKAIRDAEGGRRKGSGESKVRTWWGLEM